MNFFCFHILKLAELQKFMNDFNSQFAYQLPFHIVLLLLLLLLLLLILSLTIITHYSLLILTNHNLLQNRCFNQYITHICPPTIISTAVWLVCLYTGEG